MFFSKILAVCKILKTMLNFLRLLHYQTIFLLVPSVLVRLIILTGTLVGVLVVWILIIWVLIVWIVWTLSITRTYSTRWWWWWLIIIRVSRVTWFRSCYQFWWWLMCWWFWTLLFTSFNATTNGTSAKKK